MTNFRIGTQLSLEDQAYALRHCIDRTTRDSYRVFRAFRKEAPLMRTDMPTDQEWLARTSFACDENGMLIRAGRVVYVSMVQHAA
jgi:hypothetical protein